VVRSLRVPSAFQKQILQTISAAATRRDKMSAAIPGLVESSTNVAVIATEGDAVSLATSQRSSVASEKDEIAQAVRAVFELGGAAVSQGDGYPGWKPNMGSRVLKKAIATYSSLYGKEPEVKAIHAGLECGLIGEKYPGIDMISFGPTMTAVHSPEERIFVAPSPGSGALRPSRGRRPAVKAFILLEATHLRAEERGAALQLVHPVDPVLDRDPAVEARGPQLGEDGVVVVHPLADLAVAQALA
jgi:hypothetical protein